MTFLKKGWTTNNWFCATPFSSLKEIYLDVLHERNLFRLKEGIAKLKKDAESSKAKY
jgi:hypothetical protein